MSAYPARYRNTLLIVSVALALHIIHLRATGMNDFNYDARFHLQYIEYILNSFSLPAPLDCRECYHPPLYYILATLVYALARSTGITDPAIAVRCLSLVFYLLFLYFAARLLDEALRSRPAYYTALALLAFWPLGAIEATVIDNDIAVDMAQAAAFYYLMRWWRHRLPGSLRAALIWDGLAVSFKSTGIIICAITACIILLGWYRDRFSLFALGRSQWSAGTALALLLALLSFGRGYYYHAVHSGPMLVSNLRWLDKNMVLTHDEPYYYISFDYPTYVKEPFFNAYNDSTARDYFFNALLKTALFSEFRWKSSACALALSLLELAMVVYLAGTVYCTVMAAKKTSTDQDHEWIALLIFPILQIMALMVFRMLYPFSCSEEYRYIYAATPLLALLYAKAAEWYAQHGFQRMAWLGYALAWPFIGTSILFLLLQDVIHL